MPRFMRRSVLTKTTEKLPDRRKKVPDWNRIPLGSDTDLAIAKKLGVTRQAVMKARVARCINSYEPARDRASTEVAVLKAVPWRSVAPFQKVKAGIKREMTDRHIWRVLKDLIRMGVVKARRKGEKALRGYYRCRPTK